MYWHEGTTDFLKMFLAVVALGLFIWWVRHDFGASYALVAVVLLAGTIFFVGGAILTHHIQKSTLDGISKFNAKDATVDRFRMQSLREIAKSESYKVKADTQKQIIDYKQSVKQLPDKQQNQPSEVDTFWSNTETVDLEDWS